MNETDAEKVIDKNGQRHIIMFAFGNRKYTI